jgi:hypothetical protein
VVDRARGWNDQRRTVRVLVHRAYFQVPGAPEMFFIKVTNVSKQREVEITHIWFATEPRVDIIDRDRPLPARLRLDETFETWIEVAKVPGVPDVEGLVRVKLSASDKPVKSRLNTTVPPYGMVAGGGQR